MKYYPDAILFDLSSLTYKTGEIRDEAENLLKEIQESDQVSALILTPSEKDTVSHQALLPYLDHQIQVHASGHIPPALAGWLDAARFLEIPLSGCLAVSGTREGILTASSAGLTTVGIGPPEETRAAEVSFPGLTGLNPDNLTYAATFRVTEDHFDPVHQRHHETLFNHGNGYLSTRGTLEEGFSGDQQATLVHGLWEDIPIHFSELVNAPDWTALDVFINGQRFQMDSGTVEDYARWLDLRRGVLHRRLTWTPDSGGPIQLHFQRFTSLDDKHLLAQQLKILPLQEPAEVQVRARLDGQVTNQGRKHWELIEQGSHAGTAHLIVRTQKSRKTLAMKMRLSGRAGCRSISPHAHQSDPESSFTILTKPGETLEVEKITAVYTSRDCSDPAKSTRQKMASISQQGYLDLHKKQASAWEKFWSDGDVMIAGDNLAQLAVRHALFQLRSAASDTDQQVSIGAKALSGFGYRGHVFWDTEIFILPYFTFTHPDIARNMLLYRFHRLPGARRKAERNGFSGAQFPWESAETGAEVTPQWIPDFNNPDQQMRIWTGDLQIHISTDIAYASHQFWQVTGDEKFWLEAGLPILLETAIFWEDRVEPEGDQVSIRNVIGPDEYHDHIDNNAYTNRMVAWHFRTAIDSLAWLKENHPSNHHTLTSQYQITPKRLVSWAEIADALIFLQNPESGLIEQFEGFFNLSPLNWSDYQGRTRPIQEILGVENTNQVQVVKQADVIALLCLLGDQVDKKTWEANWNYYAPITDHQYGSSLSPAMHAWAACQAGKPEQAYQFFQLSARTDLENIRGNAGDGVHAAAAGGLWEALVFGFAGLGIKNGKITLHPQLPPRWKRVAFSIQFQGETIQVDLQPPAPGKDATPHSLGRQAV